MEPLILNVSTDSSSFMYLVLGILGTVGGSLLFAWFRNKQKKSTDIENEVLKTEVQAEKHKAVVEVKKQEVEQLEKNIEEKEEKLKDIKVKTVEQTMTEIQQFWADVLKK